MSDDPTALVAAMRAIFDEPTGPTLLYGARKRLAAAVLDALGIDPDAPLSLLRWHGDEAAYQRGYEAGQTDARIIERGLQ